MREKKQGWVNPTVHSKVKRIWTIIYVKHVVAIIINTRSSLKEKKSSMFIQQIYIISFLY